MGVLGHAAQSLLRAGILYTDYSPVERLVTKYKPRLKIR